MEKIAGKTNEKELQARWKEDGSPVHGKEKISSTKILNKIFELLD